MSENDDAGAPTPGVEQRLAAELDPERHRAPSEGVPQDLADDPDADDPPA